MLATQTVHAVVYYWDNNGTTAGYGSAGGTWASPTASQWSTSTDGTGTPGASITTTGSDTVNFGNGATGLGAGTITVSGTQNASSLTFATGSGNTTLSGGTIGSLSFITVNGSTTTTISSDISGSNINKNGTGTLILSGAKTYAGIFRLDTGTLILDETGTWGTGTLNFYASNNPTLQTTASSTKILSNRVFIGSTNANISGAQSFQFTGLVNNRGANSVLYNDITGAGKSLTFSNTLGLSNGASGANFTLSGSGTTNITGAIVNSIDDGGNVSGAGGTNQLIINSIGTVTLSGANTYGGATTIRGGGTTVLNYGTSDTSKLSDTTALTLGGTGGFGGGTLTLKGPTGSHVETVSATTLTVGGTFLTRDGANTTKLRMNAITRAAGGTISFGDATLADTDTNNFGASGVNAILGGWATLGNDWAVSANTGAANTSITALASYTTFVNNTGSSTANYLLNGGDTLGGATAIGSLKITNSSDSQTLNLGNNNLTITAASATALGGIMYAGGNDSLYTIGNGAGTGRIVSSTANQELIFAVQTGTLSVSSFIGLSSASSPVTKSGAGTMVISSNNDFTGVVNVNQGVMRLANANATGTTGGGIIVQNGAALELGNGVAIGAEALTITGTGISSGGALRNVASSTASYAGLITIGLNGAQINSDSSGALTLSGGITTNMNRNLTFGGDGNTTVQTTPITGAGNVIKAGAGTTTLTATNTYTGTTTLSGGTLSVGVTGNLGAAASNLVFNGGTLQITNTASLPNFSTIGHTVLFNSGKTVGLDISSGTFTADQVLNQASGGLDKAGNGTLVLNQTNTYTGATNVTTGTLQLDGSTHASSTVAIATAGTLTGSGTVNGNSTLTGNGIINKASGTLAGTLGVTGGNWNGAGAVTGAVTASSGTFNIGSGANLSANGGLNVTGGTIAAGNSSSTITGNLNYTSSSNSTFAGVIAGANKTLTLNSAAAKLTLSGTNTYTGATNVNAGTLAITGSGSINASSGVTVAAGANLVYNSSATITNSLSLSGAGILSRAILGGSGTIGAALTLNNLGDTLSPGNSPGIQTFTQAQTWSSFSYDWEVNNFTGTTAGTDFDRLGLNTLDLTGTVGSYILNVLSLTASNVAGNVPNFSEVNRSWTILTSSGGITGFNAANWTINTTGFTDVTTGNWALAQTGNDLVLSYAAVPEPDVAALIGGLGMLVLLRRRR